MENKYENFNKFIDTISQYKSLFEKFNLDNNPDNLLIPKLICFLCFDDTLQNPSIFENIPSEEHSKYISGKIDWLLSSWNSEVRKDVKTWFDIAKINTKMWVNNMNLFFSNNVSFEKSYVFTRFRDKNQAPIVLNNKVLGQVQDYFFLDAIIKSIESRFSIKQEFLNLYNSLELYQNDKKSSDFEKIVNENVSLKVNRISISPVAFDFSEIISHLKYLENMASHSESTVQFKESLVSGLVFLENLYNRKLIWGKIDEIIKAFGIEHKSKQSECEFIYFLLQSLEAPEVISFNNMKNNIPESDDFMAVKNFDKKVKTTIQKLPITKYFK